MQNLFMGSLMPTSPSIRKRLASGATMFGTVVTVPSAANVEALVLAGVDWLWLDMEHGPMGLETLQILLAVTNGSGVANLVRVPWNDPVYIKRALDVGADGVIVPLVTSAEQARAAVEACLYPPAGIRGVGLARAQGYGASLDEYLSRANDDIAVVVQIEHKDAVAAIDEIAAVPGLAAALIGPYDLSGTMGLLGQVDHPEVQQAVDRVIASCRAARLPVGMFVPNADQAVARAGEGVQLLAINVDINMFRQAYTDAFASAKAAVGSE